MDEFSICLNKESGRHGYLTWGASAVAEPLATARVFGKHHWATNLTDISVTKAERSPLKRNHNLLFAGIRKKSTSY